MAISRRKKLLIGAGAVAGAIYLSLLRQGLKAPSPVLSEEELALLHVPEGIVEFSGMGKYSRVVKSRRQFKRKPKVSRFQRGFRYAKKLAGMGVVATTLGAGGQLGRTMMKRYLSY